MYACSDLLFTLNTNLGDEMCCYVHDYKAVQKSGQVSYITCQLQTSAKTMEKASCFSLNKAKRLKDASEKKSPVKIKKYDFNNQYNNIVVKNTSYIEELPGPLKFSRSESHLSSEIQIGDIKTIKPGELINVKAKVYQLSGTKNVVTENGIIKKCNAILVDPFGSINMSFWGDDLTCVKDEGTYKFTNVRVREDSFTNEKLLNSAKSGFEAVECSPFTAVIGVKNVSSYLVCCVCSKESTEMWHIF